MGHSMSLIDLAMERFNGPYPDALVDEVRILLRLVPVQLSFASFWVLYYQLLSSFITQGLHMRLVDMSGLRDSFTLPASWLSLFTYLPVLVLILLAELLFLPVLNSYGWIPRLLTETRILVGNTFACKFRAITIKNVPCL